MKRHLPLMLCAALAAAPAVKAQDNTDAPLLLDAGTTTPSRGLFLPESLAIQHAKRDAATTAEVEELRKQAGVAWWVPVVIAVAAFSVGAGVGAGVALGAHK